MGDSAIAGAADRAADHAGRLAEAHRALRADRVVQFTLPPADPPPQPPPWLEAVLGWLGRVLKPVARALDWIGSFMPAAPLARILLWSLLGALALLVVWVIVARVRGGEWRLPMRRHKRLAEAVHDEAEWAPAAAPVRAWLREADALAAEGRFAEAIRHLLFRSVEDIAKRRPRLVRPALTSRELAASDAIPAGARYLFADIAGMVERSLFGGRAVGEREWRDARTTYTEFALPGSWRA